MGETSVIDDNKYSEDDKLVKRTDNNLKMQIYFQMHAYCIHHDSH